MERAVALTLIYCGPDGRAAEDLADAIRSGGAKAMVRDACEFRGDAEKADIVAVMRDVSHGDYMRLKAAYAGVRIECEGIREDTDEPVPLTAAAINDMTDADLRAWIAERTGKRPGPRTSRTKLLAAAKAAGGIA